MITTEKTPHTQRTSVTGQSKDAKKNEVHTKTIEELDIELKEILQRLSSKLQNYYRLCMPECHTEEINEQSNSDYDTVRHNEIITIQLAILAKQDALIAERARQIEERARQIEEMGIEKDRLIEEMALMIEKFKAEGKE